MNGVIWCGASHDNSGYGEATRGYLFGLHELGHDVRLIPRRFSKNPVIMNDTDSKILDELTRTPLFDGVDACLFHLTPENYSYNPDNGIHIAMTTFETNMLPLGWLLPIRGMDHVITHTEFNVETFKRAGVNKPIHVVPHGVDTQLYNTCGPSFERIDKAADGRFVILSNFDWTERKNPRALLKAYFSAFNKDDDVLLVIKSYSRFHQDGRKFILEQVAQVRGETNGANDVAILDDTLSKNDMAAIYRSADCFVLPSRGEGFGLPYIEAMATGLPTIGTGWGGNTSFMNDGNSILLSAKLVDVPQSFCRIQPQYAGQKWADVDVDEVASAMRSVYDDKAFARRIGDAAINHVRSGWTWGHACVKMADTLNKIIGA